MAILSIKLTDSGTVLAKGLIAGIITFARARGLDQNALASRTGISAEALSRLKKEGGCRLATALQLAQAAGFAAVELAAVPAGGTALSVAAQKLGAGRREPIGADELASELRSGQPQARHIGHLCGFFEELPIDLVHDVILDESLEYPRLTALAADLGAEGETVGWLAEMAGKRVADAA